MRLYKLLKDTPTIKAGTIFREVVSDYDGARELARITPIGAKTSPQFTIQDIDNFDEWFEEIKTRQIITLYSQPVLRLRKGDRIMSETEGYKGKLKLCKKYKDANELQANLQKFWQSIPREKRNKFYQDVEEIDDYELEDNGYVIIDGNCIYKIELDKEFDMDSNFVEVAKTQDDTYEFITWFYNSSTDLQEMLQKGFNQAEKGNDKCFKDGREI